jgi:hypothetical protein
MQDKFKAVSRHRPDGWLEIVEELQRQACREFGLSEDVGLMALRQAHVLLPDDPEVDEISLYRKYNRCRDGSSKVSDRPPNVNLLHFQSQNCVSLDSLLMEGNNPVVIFAGSYT